jgi:phage-related tail protein
VPKEILYVICAVLFVGFVTIWEKRNEEVIELEQALTKERVGDIGYKEALSKAQAEVGALKAEVEKSTAVLQQCVKEVETCSSVQYVSHALRIKR